MNARLGFKLIADPKRYLLRTSTTAISDGYMSIKFQQEHTGTSVYVYAYNKKTNGYSDYLYSCRKGMRPKAPMSARESTGVITIGRYKITCKQREDFLKLANALTKFRFIGGEKSIATKGKKVAKKK